MTTGTYPVLFLTVGIMWPLYAALAPRRVVPEAGPRVIGWGLVAITGWIVLQFIVVHRAWGVLFLLSHGASALAVALVARVLPFDWPGPVRGVAAFAAMVVGFLVGFYSYIIATWH